MLKEWEKGLFLSRKFSVHHNKAWFVHSKDSITPVDVRTMQNNLTIFSSFFSVFFWKMDETLVSH
jgi:hypothetical protein